VEGLAPNGPGAKLRILSISDDPGDLITSDNEGAESRPHVSLESDLEQPSPEHYAFPGANVHTEEEEPYPGATIRNVWIGNKARPASIGSALRP
jgi:hypothetical protein